MRVEIVWLIIVFLAIILVALSAIFAKKKARRRGDRSTDPAEAARRRQDIDESSEADRDDGFR